MDIFTKCLEEIRDYRRVNNAMLETLFDVNNVSMKTRIEILKAYVGKENYLHCKRKSKNQKELYKNLRAMVIAIKLYRPRIGV